MKFELLFYGIVRFLICLNNAFWNLENILEYKTANYIIFDCSLIRRFQRSNSKDPNNLPYKAPQEIRSYQLNPNNPEYKKKSDE